MTMVVEGLQWRERQSRPVLLVGWVVPSLSKRVDTHASVLPRRPYQQSIHI
jgi:hypothetical protein